MAVVRTICGQISAVLTQWPKADILFQLSGETGKTDMRILLIEDDTQNADFIMQSLALHGHTTDHAADGKLGLVTAMSEKYDVLIVDRMLPNLDGLSLVRMLRSVGNHVPAIFLTTMTGIDDRVEGLKAGGDDYLVKPFAFSELLARLEVLGRRPSPQLVRTCLRVGNLEVDLLKRSVRRDGATISLLPQEFRLLEYLMQSEGRIVTRSMLLEKVWGYHFDPQTSIVETHISRLRAKIDRGFAQEYLRTIRGAGYCMRAED